MSSLPRTPQQTTSYVSVDAHATQPGVRHPHASNRIWGWRTILLTFVVGILIALPLYFYMLWPWLSHWGASADEVTQTLPGDELVANPLLVTTKAVTINAPPDQVWPWLVQLGVDRGGMYSYLWVENWLLRLNVENSDAINPAWQTLKVGDFIRFTPKDFALNPGPGLYVKEMQPAHALIGCFGMEDKETTCTESATWQFVLTPQGDHSTRLILRSRTAGEPSFLATMGGKVGGALQFYMERKMLLGIQARAEGQ